MLADHDFHPDESTVRIFRTPSQGVLRLDDSVAISQADYDGTVLRHYAFAGHWFKINVTAEHGSTDQQAGTWLTLANLARDRSDYDQAQARYEQALALYRQIQDDEWGQDVLGQATSLKGLGDTARATADHDTAQARYEQALELYRQAGDVRGEARCINGLGDIALDRTDPDGARRQYEQALALYQAIPDPCSAGWTLISLARLDPPGSERTRHWSAARQAWASTGREDLVESVSAEFE